jgi:undecaprenyl-diphosphatase
MMHTLIHWDQQLFWLINHAHNRPLDWLMLTVTSLGELAAVWWVVAGVVLFADRKNGKRVALLLVIALLLTYLLDNFLLRHLWVRQRPYLALHAVHRLGVLWAGSSFPSGHASSVIAVSIVLRRYYRRLTVPLVVFAALTLVSRPYLGMHYPLDVLAGGASGVCAGCVVLWLARRKHEPLDT